MGDIKDFSNDDDRITGKMGQSAIQHNPITVRVRSGTRSMVWSHILKPTKNIILALKVITNMGIKRILGLGLQ